MTKHFTLLLFILLLPLILSANDTELEEHYHKLGVKNLVELLVHKSGVRAEILKSGEISTYNRIKVFK